ncbi:hypothetical protein [Streptomonospora arabica]|uniref:Response regulatory domain-containing protein n=1 Tax=Streptomonospora arabica TaxID=412417 RepID=A0ABV9SMY2_9ACTN
MAGPGVLVADDEPDIVDTVSTVLESHGFDTAAAATASAGSRRSCRPGRTAAAIMVIVSASFVFGDNAMVEPIPFEPAAAPSSPA